MLLASLLLLSGALVHAKPVLEGPARVVDGDTLYIGRDKIRLYGIDAPEKSQECKDAQGKPYACGKAATDALAQKVGKQQLRCEVKDIDQYQRNVAACSIKPATTAAKAEDLGTFMVTNGHATAYRAITKEYVAHEDRARLQKKGIWAGNFQNPSQWRKAQKAQESQAAGVKAQQPQQQQPRPQQPRPQPAQQMPLGPRADAPAASSVGAGTGQKPSYASVVGH